ncbi:hypothetical protein [Brevibacillus brevis]|uniref:hypothetical protein n=1 Tax=Brevibacillus brevis TaxID=1393 RepID=UPI0007D8AB6B|nr:hypothetical protein [Brevibacillus brevis]
MSLDILNGKIRVLNYEQSPVGFPSQHNQQGVFIRGRDENEDFVIERVAFDDIEIENSKSDLFKVGRLRFHPDEEDEIYLKLGIEDKENILSDKQLFDLLTNDSIDVIKRISSLKSLSLLTRMKSKLFTMERTGKMPPHTITAVVSERLSELKNGGKRNPDSEINRIMELDKKAQQEGKLQETLDQLMKKVETLEQETKQKDVLLSKSQAAIEDLLAKVDSLSEVKQAANATDDNKKQVGRPPKDK